MSRESGTILLVGTEARVAALDEALRGLGARTLPFPTVRIAPPEDHRHLDGALRSWSSFDWVVFTSSNGVETVMGRASRLGILAQAGGPRIATVGPATKEAAEAAGLIVNAMPVEFLTDAIADCLGDVRGRRILLPRSNLARRSLAETLLARGALVDEVDAYETLPTAPNHEPLERSDVGMIAFTSASAVRNLVALVRPTTVERLRGTAVAACIGPVTAQAAKEAGFRVAIVAQPHTVPGLVHSLQEATAFG